MHFQMDIDTCMSMNTYGIILVFQTNDLKRDYKKKDFDLKSQSE